MGHLRAAESAPRPAVLPGRPGQLPQFPDLSRGGERKAKVLALFHFALVQGGHLFLGPAETLGRSDELFETVSKKWRLYRRVGPTRHEIVDFPIAGRRIPAPGGRLRAAVEPSPTRAHSWKSPSGRSPSAVRAGVGAGRPEPPGRSTSMAATDELSAPSPPASRPGICSRWPARACVAKLRAVLQSAGQAKRASTVHRLDG